MFALSRLFGHAAARRAARAVLGAELGWEQRLPVARVSDPIAIQATPDGAACGFYSAGFVELLRLLVGYEVRCSMSRAARAARRDASGAPPAPILGTNEPPLLENFDFPALRELLGKLGADGWLLYDFHGINPAATRVLGIRGMGSAASSCCFPAMASRSRSRIASSWRPSTDFR